MIGAHKKRSAVRSATQPHLTYPKPRYKLPYGCSMGKAMRYRGGKVAKDRITMLPETLKNPLQNRFQKVKALHEKDLVNLYSLYKPQSSEVKDGGKQLK